LPSLLREPKLQAQGNAGHPGNANFYESILVE
jgi:hypothetical protein